MGRLSERVKLGMAWLGLAAVTMAPVAYTAYKSSEHKKAEQAKQAQVAVIHDNPIEPAIEPIVEPVMSPFDICIDGLKDDDGLEYAKENIPKVKSAIKHLNANFCEVPSEICPVDKSYLSDLESAVNLINKYAPAGIEVNVMYTEFADYFPNFNTSINGQLVVSSRLLEKIDGIAAAFAYKASHPEFDILNHFKEMEKASFSRDPIIMPPADYDKELSNDLRKAIIAYATAHEAGHVMREDAERIECGYNRNKYFSEEGADRFAAEFILASPEIALKAAPLLFWMYDEINEYNDNGECRTNKNAYERGSYPCAAYRYGFLKDILNKSEIDTSQIDSIFGVLQ